VLFANVDDVRPDWQIRKQQMEHERALEQQRIALHHARRRQMEYLAANQLQAGEPLSYMQGLMVLRSNKIPGC
jgi:hypothetical protein